MEELASISSLMLVVGIAFFVPIVLHRFRLKFIPVVVAEILAGIIIGKSGLNLIHHDPWLELLSMLGLIYLMFLSGLEIDFTAFRSSKKTGEKWPNPFLLAVIIFGGMLILSFGLAFGMASMKLVEEPVLMTIVLSTVSLGVVVPVLKEKKIINTGLGQSILLTAVVSDFVTMLLFVYYLSTKAEDNKSFLLISVLFISVVIVYFIVKKVAKGKIYHSLRKGTTQLGTRGVFALILLFVVLSETVGAENILGAFLAGVVISLLAPEKEFIHQLDSFGYGFLIPIFFVMVGVNLEVQSLFQDKAVLLLIPVLLISLYIARIVPAFILRRYFSWKESASSGILLGSTMSLAIVVASVALSFRLISESVSSAIVLVAIITCFISPILFQKIIPAVRKQKTAVSIIGANGITLPVSLDLQAEDFDVTLYSTPQNKIQEQSHQYPIMELNELDLNQLKAKNAFASDVLVLGTSDDIKNIGLAKAAREEGVERIIVRAEDPDMQKKLAEENYSVFSTIHSARILLKSLVDNPGVIQMLTHHNDTLQQIIVGNEYYHELPLRQLPFLGDALIVKIYRGEASIIPHGDTRLLAGDKILASGSPESIQKMKDELE